MGFRDGGPEAWATIFSIGNGSSKTHGGAVQTAGARQHFSEALPVGLLLSLVFLPVTQLNPQLRLLAQWCIH